MAVHASLAVVSAKAISRLTFHVPLLYCTTLHTRTYWSTSTVSLDLACGLVVIVQAQIAGCQDQAMAMDE